jgi:glycine/sarcosine N-methyltransferase
MCQLIPVSRRSFYRSLKEQRPAEEETEVRSVIQQIALEHRHRYGYRRITAELRRRGMQVNHKRVVRIMQEDNLLALQPKHFKVTTNSNHKFEVYLNLAARMKLTGINQLWVADITYIRLKAEFVYLAVILRILDCARGIGTQTLGLASLGFTVTACDLSPASGERTRMEAAKRRLNVQLFVADMLDLTEIPDKDFDAVMCMDNALPHLERDDQLFQAATQIRRKLRGGAIFMGSIRDYDSLVQERPVVQGPAFYSDQGSRHIVHQVWDWSDERRYAFHLYITRETQGGWETQHYVSNYRAVLREEFSRILQAAGFIGCRWILPAESGFYQPIVLAKQIALLDEPSTTKLSCFHSTT